MISRSTAFTLIATAVAALVAACDGGSSGNLEEATFLEGRGIEPDLIVGSTTLIQARQKLGKGAHEPSAAGNTTELWAPPLRLTFVAKEDGGEPVLYAIAAGKIYNPKLPQFKGKTGRGIVFLDSVEKMRATYGEPAALQISSPYEIYYYSSGLILSAEHPSSISDFDGPPPTPTSRYITRMLVTVPFQVTGQPQRVQAGQRVIMMRPTTTLPFSDH